MCFQYPPVIILIMVKRKSAFGLCKPHKKWKKNNTKAQRELKKAIYKEVVQTMFF